MDEIDAIGGRRFSEGTSADREIQRTLMELLNQLDGFDQLGKVRDHSLLFREVKKCSYFCSASIFEKDKWNFIIPLPRPRFS